MRAAASCFVPFPDKPGPWLRSKVKPAGRGAGGFGTERGEVVEVLPPQAATEAGWCAG